MEKNQIKVIKKILIFSNAEPEEKNIKVDIKEINHHHHQVVCQIQLYQKIKYMEMNLNQFILCHQNEIKNEKIDMLYKFRKLEGQGIRTTMNYSMTSNLEDMRTEYYKLKKQRETENSVKFQRKILMAVVTGAEF